MMTGVLSMDAWQAVREVHSKTGGLATLKTGFPGICIDPRIRTLAAAILLQAIRDVLRIGTDLPRHHRDYWQKNAWEWFFSEDRRPGSLRWISQIIEIDVEKTRRWLQEKCCGSQDVKKQTAQKITKIYATRLR